MYTTLDGLDEAIKKLREMTDWDICQVDPVLKGKISAATMGASIILGQIKNTIGQTQVIDLIRAKRNENE